MSRASLVIKDCSCRDRSIICCLVELINEGYDSRAKALVDMIKQDPAALEEFWTDCIINDALTVDMLRVEAPELFNTH